MLSNKIVKPFSIFKKIKNYIVLTLIMILLLVSTSSKAQIVKKKETSILGLKRSSCDVADFDFDGDLDLLISGSYFDSEKKTAIFGTYIYLNDGEGNFSKLQTNFPGVTAGSVSWGDYDIDGDLDILICGLTNYGPITKVFKNEGDYIFRDAYFNIKGITEGEAVWNDFDSDGDLDVFIIGLEMDYPIPKPIAMLYQNRDSIFVPIDSSFHKLADSSAEFFDFDSDGNEDLIISGYNIDKKKDYTYLYHNDKQKFKLKLTKIKGVSNGDISCGDFDADGDEDILISGGQITKTTKIYENKNGNFKEYPTLLPALDMSKSFWCDVDNDGFLDIFLMGFDISQDVIIQLYRNANGRFLEMKAELNNSWLGNATFADFNTDGFSDFLITGVFEEEQKTNLYLNQIKNKSQIPPTPKNSRYKLIDNVAYFDWDKTDATDNKNNRLTYDLIFSTNSIIDSLKNLNIQNYKQTKGNCSSKTKKRIHNIKEGIVYYWGVRAINNSLKASKTSKEQTFLIGFEADLDTSTVEYCSGTLVKISNKSSNALTYEWWLNDMKISTNKNFVHKIENEGKYIVRMIAKNKHYSDTLFKTIIIHPNPTATLNQNFKKTEQICIGDSILISIKNQENQKYNWFFNNTPLQDKNSADIYAKKTGVYYANIKNKFGCRNKTKNVKLKTLALPFSNIEAIDKTEFCANDSTFLKSESSKNTKHKWFKNDVELEGEKQEKLLVKSTGRYKLLVIDTNGCKKKSNLIKIQVNPLPDTTLNFSSSTNSCEDDTLSVSLNTKTKNKHQWYFDGRKIRREKSNKLYIKHTGKYKVHIETQHRCRLISNEVQVNIFAQPVAKIVAKGTNFICGHEKLELQIESSDAVKYKWYKNEVELKNEKHQRIETLDTGKYTCIVTDKNFCKTKTKPFIAKKTHLDFKFENKCSKIPISFNTYAKVPEGYIDYEWSFGDNTFSNKKELEKSYDKYGNYSVKLKAKFSNFCTDEITKIIEIYPKPQNNFEAKNLCITKITKLKNLTTIAKGNIKTSKWFINNKKIQTKQNAKEIDYKFQKTNKFQVKLLTFSDKNCSDTLSKEIEISPLPNVQIKPTQGDFICGNNENTLHIGQNDFKNILWYFWKKESNRYELISEIDGSQLSTNMAGKYKVQVEDKNYCTNESSEIIIKKATIDFSFENACQEAFVEFNKQVNIFSETIKYHWDFGDNTNSNEENPKKRYTKAGEYNITLTVDLNKNCKLTKTKKIIIYPKPKANFSYSESIVNKEIKFIDNSTLIEGDITTRIWDFGEEHKNIAGKLNENIHIYKKTGSYKVSLSIISNKGCSSKKEKILNIKK